MTKKKAKANDKKRGKEKRRRKEKKAKANDKKREKEKKMSKSK